MPLQERRVVTDAPTAGRTVYDRVPRVAVVTGASRGLGSGIATHLAGMGVALGLCARTTPEAPDAEVPTVCASVDVADVDAVEAFALRVTDELGPIEMWINNAGVLDPIGPLRDARPDELAVHVAVNLTGVMWGSRTYARLVHGRQGPGVLVNITSGAARSAYQGWAAYCATKAAVDQLSRVLAAEEADHGLAVFAVAPGVVDTDMQALIRSTPADRFPTAGRFIDLAETDSFNSPGWVATQLLELYASTTGAAGPDWARVSADGVVLRIPDEPR